MYHNHCLDIHSIGITFILTTQVGKDLLQHSNKFVTGEVSQINNVSLPEVLVKHVKS